ncbi:MAG: hypothetical protein IT369_00435 [Candidatus Latescibacteria bacterium]|nr:hypothetical protein [Candidatus Latescibacterota bacterium]
MSVLLMEDNTKLESFGFKPPPGGVHAARTMMLAEVVRLWAVTNPSTNADEYRRLVVEDNILGKPTETSRVKTFRHLRDLYGLSPRMPLFAIYRELVAFDPESLPLLSLLVAWTRDSLLRATTPVVLAAAVGTTVVTTDWQSALVEAFPGHYSALSIASTARNSAATWTQSGHFRGLQKKTRYQVQPRPAALALALLLANVSGIHGDQVFTSPWCQLLDLNAAQARSLAFQAHREELLSLRAIGSVVEIDFPRFGRLLKDYL